MMKGWRQTGEIRTKLDFLEVMLSREMQRLRDNAERPQQPVGWGRNPRWAEGVTSFEGETLTPLPCWRGYVADSLPGVE